MPKDTSLPQISHLAICLHLLKVLILKLQRMNYNRNNREMQGLFSEKRIVFQKELFFLQLCYIIHYVIVSVAALLRSFDTKWRFIFVILERKPVR